MPRLKTKKAIVKRIKVTGCGKVKISKAFRGHLLTRKTRKRLRHLKQKALIISKKRAAKLKRMLPYR